MFESHRSLTFSYTDVAILETLILSVYDVGVEVSSMAYFYKQRY